MRRHDHHHARRQAGITLLEVVTCGAVLAILAALAWPGLREMTDRVRADTIRMQLASAFASARATAVTRRHPVSICGSHDGRSCTGDWRGGWLIYRDPGRASQPASQDDVLRHHRLDPRSRLKVSSSEGRHRLRYTPDGRSIGTNLTITVCAGGTLHGEVVTNNSGRTRSHAFRGQTPCGG